MPPERQHAASVLTGLAAFTACVFLRAPGVVSVSAALVYAAGAYFVAEHPEMLRDRGGGNWTSGVFAGVTTFALVGLVQTGPGVGVVALAFGLTYLGFAAGIAFATEE